MEAVLAGVKSLRSSLSKVTFPAGTHVPVKCHRRCGISKGAALPSRQSSRVMAVCKPAGALCTPGTCHVANRAAADLVACCREALLPLLQGNSSQAPEGTA